jgi:polysaccharide export outer membrane protein
MKQFARDTILTALCAVSLTAPLAAQNTALPAAPSSAVPPAPARATPGVSTYRITPGDQIEIYVWGEERLQRSMRVLPDGTIAFPLVGQVSVAGRLPQEVEAAIRSGLSSQYRGEVPQVTVSVVAPAPTQFTVLGRVSTPGTFETQRSINVLEALSLAGGGTEFANLDRIVVLRKTANGLTPLEANIKPLMRGRIDAAALQRANLITIEAGDTIIVP